MKYRLAPPTMSTASALTGHIEEIPVQCPGCRSRVLVPPGIYSSGTSIRCPNCRGVMAAQGADFVPSEPPIPTVHVNYHGAPPPAPVSAPPPPESIQRLLLGSIVAVATLIIGVAGILVLSHSINYDDPALSIHNATLLQRDKERMEKQLESIGTELKAIHEEKQKIEADRNRLIEDMKKLQEKVVFIGRWRSASFILLDHNRFATALQAGAKGMLTVLAKAEHPWSDYAVRVAHRFQIPLLDRDTRLAQRVHAEAPLGQPLVQPFDAEVRKHWQVHKYVPPVPDEVARFLLFNDVTSNRNRIGFFLKADHESADFYPVGRMIERVSRSQIEPGSARRGTADDLKRDPRIDFLDMAVLLIAQKLGATENSPRLINIAVQVKVDTLEEFLELSHEPDTELNDIFFDFLARARLEPYRADSRKAHSRWLRDAARALNDELVSRLNKLDIPLVESEEVGEVIAERELANRPDFEDRNYGKLLCATHLIIAEVDKPTNDGKLRLSIRLTEVDSRRTVWAENCDIDRCPPREPATFLLNSGTPALVAFANPTPNPNRPAPPLLLLPLAAKPEEESPRLCYIEHSPVADHVILRDFFSHELRSVPKSAIKSIDEQISIERIAKNQRLRLLMWELARHLLPTGGRVANVTSDRVAISLGRDAGLSVGTRLKVWRLAGDVNGYAYDLDRWRVLPLELATAEVSDAWAKATLAAGGIAQIWPDAAQLAVGDIVVNKDALPPRVAIMAPVLDTSLIDDKLDGKFRIKDRAAYERTTTNVVRGGQRLRQHLETSLLRLRVPCTSQLTGNSGSAIAAGVPLAAGRAAGATHVVYGSICPSSVHADAQGISVSLHVLDVARGEVSLSLPTFTITLDQIADWRP